MPIAVGRPIGQSYPFSDCWICDVQYLRKLQSARQHEDGGAVKMADSGTGSSWWGRGASWSSVIHVVLVSGRQMSPNDGGTGSVYVKFKFASERYLTRVL